MIDEKKANAPTEPPPPAPEPDDDETREARRMYFELGGLPSSAPGRGAKWYWRRAAKLAVGECKRLRGKLRELRDIIDAEVGT